MRKQSVDVEQSIRMVDRARADHWVFKHKEKKILAIESESSADKTSHKTMAGNRGPLLLDGFYTEMEIYKKEVEAIEARKLAARQKLERENSVRLSQPGFSDPGTQKIGSVRPHG